MNGRKPCFSNQTMLNAMEQHRIAGHVVVLTLLLYSAEYLNLLSSGCDGSSSSSCDGAGEEGGHRKVLSEIS